VIYSVNVHLTIDRSTIDSGFQIPFPILVPIFGEMVLHVGREWSDSPLFASRSLFEPSFSVFSIATCFPLLWFQLFFYRVGIRRGFAEFIPRILNTTDPDDVISVICGIVGYHIENLSRWPHLITKNSLLLTTSRWLRILTLILCILLFEISQTVSDRLSTDCKKQQCFSPQPIREWLARPRLIVPLTWMVLYKCDIPCIKRC
jgi:hypothetical protein